MIIQKQIRIFCCGLLLSIIAGCSSQVVPPRTVPVSGKVLKKGKPVEGVKVELHPEHDLGYTKFIPYGETDAEGKFTISTGAAGNGAPPGNYAVTLQKLKVISDKQNSGTELEVDEWKGKYADPQKPLKNVLVDKDHTELAPFELE